MLVIEITPETLQFKDSEQKLKMIINIPNQKLNQSVENNHLANKVSQYLLNLVKS